MSNPPNVIFDLVKKFERNLEEYKHPKYNETLIRVEFVNPFWKALGWDVDNEKGYAMAYRDVIHEDDLKVGRTSRAPDYAFRVGGTRKFFLETKKPHTDLKHDPSPAFQLRRYAYSAKLPVSMLTDFEEFIVYNCRLKPAITDKPHTGRMLYYTFREYPEKWDEISERFSKQAVLQGNFDRFIEDTQGKRPRAEIDRDFLNDLDSWRITLARNIALRNPDLSERELNYAVQMTIDRLIFLRMCEDRDIEQYETLLGLSNGVRIYPRLVQLYYKADSRYNSGLFHFEEKDGAHPDELTPKLKIDDKALKDIISELYYPKCPYEFSVLPVEVLGNAYEQFLGKQITLTKGHRARIEEKQEVRKAGGVYYTPQYIVDYIVKNTVGKLCEGKTPADISELRVLDPACGSGSFLLGAFQYLLDWHRDWYRKKIEDTGDVPTCPPTKGKRKRKSDPQAIFQGGDGEWYLTTAEKKRILTNNIFGVDIDANAVEVTKLSLLLKVLEHESSETLNRQLGLWQERALPNLASNVKCGNSLIGTDFYEQQQTALFDEEEAMRVNAFDWEREFPEIFERGGFDAVIGNPPYVRIQTLNEFSREQVEYFNTEYRNYICGNYDIYILFICRGFKILRKHGVLGYILPHKFFQGEMGKNIRKYIAKESCISKVVNFSTNQIFESVSTYTCLLFLVKSKLKGFKYKKFELGDNYKDLKNIQYEDIDSKVLHRDMWNFHPKNIQNILDKINEMEQNFENITEKIFKGSSTGNDKVFLLKLDSRGEKSSSLFSTSLNRYVEIENELLKKFIYGQDVRRYYIKNSGIYLLFPYIISENKASLIDSKTFKEKYPLGLKYLNENQSLLLKRKIKIGDNDFYKFSAARSLVEYHRNKILIPDMLVKCRISIDSNGEIFHGPAIHSIVFKRGDDIYNDLFYLGILNSNIFWFFIKNTSTALRGDAYRLTPEFLNPFNFPRSSEQKAEELIKMVQRILQMQLRLAEGRDLRTCETVQRQIAATDNQIDQLVYQLYGLTDEEIKIVEEAVK